MRHAKPLALLATFVVAGAVTAMAALAYAAEAKDVRARLRGAYDRFKARLSWDEEPPRIVPAEHQAHAHKAHAAQDALVQAEHVLEHGAEGRARAHDQSKKPHVRA